MRWMFDALKQVVWAAWNASVQIISQGVTVVMIFHALEWGCVFTDVSYSVRIVVPLGVIVRGYDSGFIHIVARGT